MPKPRKLSPRQALFITEYLKDQNATQAAIRAGYSAKTARQQGAKQLSKVAIRSAILDHQRQVTEKATVDAAWLLNRLASLADADVTQAFKEDGKTLKPIAELPEDLRRLLSGFEVSQDLYGGRHEITKKIKLESRLKVLEMIGKHTSVAAFQRETEPARAVVVIIKDYTGREIGAPVVDAEAKELESG